MNEIFKLKIIKCKSCKSKQVLIAKIFLEVSYFLPEYISLHAKLTAKNLFSIDLGKFFAAKLACQKNRTFSARSN